MPPPESDRDRVATGDRRLSKKDSVAVRYHLQDTRHRTPSAAHSEQRGHAPSSLCSLFFSDLSGPTASCSCQAIGGSLLQHGCQDLRSYRAAGNVSLVTSLRHPLQSSPERSNHRQMSFQRHISHCPCALGSTMVICICISLVIAIRPRILDRWTTADISCVTAHDIPLQPSARGDAVRRSVDDGPRT